MGDRRIPEGWKECKLGEVANFSYGIMPKKDKVGYGIYPIFSGYKYQDFYFERNCQKGDIIVVARGVGGTGDVKIVKEDCFLTNLAIKIDFDKTIVDNKFFYYLCLPESLRYLDSGSAQSQITITDLARETFLLPTLPEQRAIASVLGSLDDKIDLLNRENQTLEQMAEAIFRQWFIEEADEEWEEKTLGTLFEISSGKGLKKEQLNENGIYSVLGANGIIGRTDNFLYDEKLIYTGRVGTLGSIFIVENEKVWLSDNTLVIKPHKYFYSVYFILKYSKLEEYNVGSTQPLIRQSDIKGIGFVLPSELIMKKFEMTAEVLFSKIRANNSQIHTLEKLRDTLLPKLMSGVVRVKFTDLEVQR